MKATIASNVIPDVPDFKIWLSQHGAEVLEPTNEWELVRFKTGKGTSVIYRRKHDFLACSFIGDALTAYKAYKTGGIHSKWRAIPRTNRVLNRSSVDCITIRKRDGDNCFFCDCYVKQGNETVEHLVCLTHGGPQHISNKYLAHKDCNALAGHKSAVEKIEIHTKAVLGNALRKHYAERKQNN